MVATPTVDDSTAEAFAETITGSVILPTHDEYDDARAVWNGMIDRHPAMIVRCGTPADVAATIEFASAEDLPLAVRAGGHSVAGKSTIDDGVVVDLSEMTAIHVDVDAKVAHVETGALLADLDAATQEHGLATPLGVASITGVAGLTLGGGIGYLSRAYGLACDNLVGADVVTADGDLVRASEDENADLLWGLRGGGGNLGVVTAMEFRLHDVGPDVLAGPVFYDADDAATVLRAYREYLADAPDEVACVPVFTPVPAMEPFPESHHGETALALVLMYAGDPSEGEPHLAELRSVVDPVFDGVAETPYVDLQQSFDEATPDGGRYYWKSEFLADLTDDAIDTIVEHAVPIPNPMSNCFVETMGGAIGRVDADATAFPHRDAPFNFGISGGWSDPADDDEMMTWVREFHDAMKPYGTDGVYANYLDRDDADRVQHAFGVNYERMAALKAAWDPENVFSQTNNVQPASDRTDA